MTLTEQVFSTINDRIITGSLAPGQRLPSVRSIAAQLQVSPKTVLRAYDKLIASGRVHAIRGSGFYVTPLPAVAQSPSIPQKRPLLDEQRLVYSEHPLDKTPGSGILRHDEDAKAEVGRVLRTVLPTIDYGGGYSDPLGYLPLRQELRIKLANEGVEVSVDDIVTTSGGIAAITLIVRALVRPGDWVLTEDPSSFMHRHILLSQGAEIAFIPRLADGPDLDVLRAVCERHRPFMFLLSSVLHNPTGHSISPPKAQALIELASEFDLLLVDDNSYIDLRPGTDIRAGLSLILLGGMKRIIHVGSFSHTIAPSFGPGYIVASGERMELIHLFRPTLGLGNTLIQERVLYRFLNEGIYRRRCERIRARLARRFAGLVPMMTRIGISVRPSNSGLFIWSELPENLDAATVAKYMLGRGYLTAPGKHFTSGDIYKNYLRFNVTTTDASAMDALGATMKQVLGASG